MEFPLTLDDAMCTDDLDQSEEGAIPARLLLPESELEQEPKHRRKQPKASEVWKYCTLIAPKKVRCELCNNEFAYCMGATSNLRKHLLKMHKIEVGKTVFKKRTRIKNKDGGEVPETIVLSASPLQLGVPQKAKSKTQELLNKLLLQMICIDYQPVSMVEDDGFSKLMAFLYPGCAVPSQQEISDVLLPELFNDVSVAIAQELQQVGAVCIVIESWPSLSAESYIAITCHFIDSQFQLKSATIGVEEIATDSPEIITEVIRNTLQQWQVHSKVVCFVTDDISSLKIAADALGCRWIGCFAHTLTDVVQECLDAESFVFMKEKVKTIVKRLKTDPKAMSELGETQKTMKIPSRRLIIEVSAQWNSTVDMLTRYIELEPAVRAVAKELNISFEFPTVNEQSIVQHMIELLSPFKEATELMATQSRVHASEVTYIASSLHKKTCAFAKSKVDIPEEVRKISNSMVTSMENYGFDSLGNNSQLAIATFLDPRMKNLGFKDESIAGNAQVEVVSAAARVDYPPDSQTFTTQAYQLNEDGTYTLIGTTSSLWDDLENRVAVLHSQGPEVEANEETKRYLEDDRLNRAGDPLSWWKERQHLYPRLSRVAKEVMSILCNCGPCDRLFSKTGQIVINRRSALSGRQGKMITFISSNYHFIQSNV